MYPEEGVTAGGLARGKGYGLKADVWSLGVIGTSFSFFPSFLSFPFSPFPSPCTCLPVRAVLNSPIAAFICMGGRFPYKKTDPVELVRPISSFFRLSVFHSMLSSSLLTPSASSQAHEARTTKLYFPRSWETISEEGASFFSSLHSLFLL